MSKVSDYPTVETGNISDDDLLYLVDSAAGTRSSKKITLRQLGDYIGRGGTTPGPTTLTDGSVITRYIADHAVTAAKLADDSVTGRKIASGAVATGHIADDAVTGAKIPRDAIDQDHLAANSVGNSEMRSDAVDEANLTPAVRTKLNARVDPTSGLNQEQVDARIQNWVGVEGSPSDLEDAIEILFRTNFDFSDMPQVPSIGAPNVGGALTVRSVDTTTGVIVLEWKVPRGGTGDDAASWAEVGNTSLIPKAKLPHYLSVVPSINPTVIERTVGGEKDGDIVIGYSASTIAIFRYSASANDFREVVQWPRVASGGGRSDSALEMFIETIVEPWAIRNNADGIPGSKTYDGLFKSENETPIPAANVTVSFNVGDASNRNEVDETDAADTSFVITEQQANQSGSFLRVDYSLSRTAAEGDLPRDIELILQNADTGATLTKHNLKDEGGGHAQFAFGDAGRKRWAVRCVTTGRYAGNLTISDTTYHSAEPIADMAIQHVVHPIVSDEAEKRQSEDRRLTEEIERVEQIKAIVNGLPASASVQTKSNIRWKVSPPYEQVDADRFQVPATGYVQFLLGNIGQTAIMRAEDCVNRELIVYDNGTHEIKIEFSSDRKARLVAISGSARSSLATTIAPTATNYKMVVWSAARAGGTTPRFQEPHVIVDAYAIGDTLRDSADRVTSFVLPENYTNWRYLEIMPYFNTRGSGSPQAVAAIKIPTNVLHIQATARNIHLGEVNGQEIESLWTPGTRTLASQAARWVDTVWCALVD